MFFSLLYKTQLKMKLCLFILSCFASNILVLAQEPFSYQSFFYGGLGIASPQYGGVTLASNSVLYNSQSTLFEDAAFNFKSPSLHLGYLYHGKPLLFRVDVAYWFGKKDIQYYFVYQTSNADLSNQNGPAYTNQGDVYYQVTQNFIGRVNLNYLDVSAVVGKTLGRYVSLLMGLRTNSMLYYSVKGLLNENSVKWLYSGTSGASSVYLGQTQTHYKDNEIKRPAYQQFQNKIYLTFGINTIFKLGARDGFMELDYDIFLNNKDPRTTYNFFNLRMGIALFKTNQKLLKQELTN